MDRGGRNRVIALTVTIVIHAVVVAALMFLAFRTPLPLPGEAGVEVNLGMYRQGTGGIQPKKPVDVEESMPEPKQVVKDDMASQTTEETPAIEEPKQLEKPKQAVNQQALFKPKKNKEALKSQGVTGDAGDQGSPDGMIDSDDYEGRGGSGGGPSVSLGGRGAKHLPSPNSNFSEEGKIVVNIWVDRDGNVKKADIGKGTNISNAYMQEMAINAALSAKFTPDGNADETQKGTITYNFIIRQ